MKRKRRLKILTELEQRLYYQRPYFDEEERYYFFKLSEEECAFVENKSPTLMIYTILQLGYFKAKQQFFKVNYSDIQADWTWIQRQYITQPINTHKLPSRNIQAAIKYKIAAFFGYQMNRALINAYLQEQSERLVRQTNDPVILFKELFLSLKQNKMVLPGYSTMQDIISKASTVEEARLYKLIEQHLTSDIKNQLAVLLNNDDELNSLREIKKDLSGFNYSAMKREIHLHQFSQPLYGSAKAMLLHFQVAEQAIVYYADCINYYSTYELRRMPKAKCYLYLLCYIYYRYQQMNDSLIQAFIYHVDKIKKTAGIHAAKLFSQQQKTLLADPKSIGVLIGNYANEPLLKLNKKFNEVAKEAYQLMPKEMIAQISQQMIKQANYQTELEWQYYHEHRQYMELNLRPIFKALTFQADKKDHPLIEAATFLKAIFAKGTTITKVSSTQFPKRAIPKKFKEIILDTQGNVRPYHYEFLVYYKLREYLVKNILYLNDSVHYKSFTEDAKTSYISKETKEMLVKKMNKPKLLVPIKDRLLELEQEVEALYVEVNQAIASGQNKQIKIKTANGETSWRLKYPAAGPEFNHKFYEKLPIVNIADVLDFVNDECHFMEAFKHFRVKKLRGELDYQAIKAVLIAEGTRQGIYKMADQSNLKVDTLRRNKQNYVRAKTIKNACKKIIKKMSRLPIAQHYMIQDKHFCSLDGSKKGTAKKTAQSRHSPKYFGLARGLSVMGMLMDNILVNSDYISCNEYEGHQIYDLYFNHDADFDPDVIAMDTHGSNQFNFCLFDTIDIQLAICYKNIFEKSKQLCGFKSPEHYEGMLIKPSKKTNTALIIKQDNAIRDVLLAILSKTTKQSVLIKKLCHHGRKTELKKAAWEYNNIFCTRFLLNYIHDPVLQKSVRMTLNRGEASNKFYNTIVKVGGKKFKGKSETQLRLENQATRLLMLIISFYNMYILSAAINQKQAQKDDKAVKILANISPMATQHLNLSGMYYYGEGAGINIDDIITALTKAADNFFSKKKKDIQKPTAHRKKVAK